MSKISKGVATIIILLIIIIIGYGAIKIITTNNFYKNRLAVSLPSHSIILQKIDTHGGFHGDGEYYSEIQLTKDGAKKFINAAKETKKWNLLPLPISIQKKVYGGEYDGINYGVSEIASKIPKDIKNGMCYIRDRYSEKYPNEKNTDIDARYSYNFTISILDLKTNKLYIYELDT